MSIHLKLSLAIRLILIFTLIAGWTGQGFVISVLAASNAVSTSPLGPGRTLGKIAALRPLPSPSNLSAPNLANENFVFQMGFPTTSVLDDFNRANGALGNNWGGLRSGYAVASQRMDVNAGGDIYWTANYFGVDQEAYVTLTAIDLNADEICLELKAQSASSIDPGQAAVVYHPGSSSVQVWTYSTSQGWVPQGSPLPVSYANGDVFGVRALASGQVEVYRNGSLLGSRSITSWPYYAHGGSIGLFHLNAGNTLLDDFGGGTMSGSPTMTPVPGQCTDPTSCNPVNAIPALWRCNAADCSGSDWVGAVIAWPSWSAYQNNARTGNNARIVYSASNQPLYPYMGSWADGCRVTAVSGVTLIIEWQRGTDKWRETILDPGQSHTIDLVSPEDGAMIESPDGFTSFSVSLSNCTPQNIFGATPTATIPSSTPSYTPTATLTPSNTSTATFTLTPTLTPTNTPSATATNTFTATPSATATSTFTTTPTATWKVTATHTPTFTPSATATQTPTATNTKTATAIPTATFRDVPVSHWAWSYVERLYSANITSGCGGGYFCPTTRVTRDQMSAFMLKAKYGASYLPPNAVGMFKDVPASNWAARWVEQAAREGIIPACNVSLKLFCPTSPVTRDNMAVFLLKAKYGTSYIPPKPAGIFTDVSVSYWAAPWIEKLAADGVTYGCTVTPRKYCPTMTVTREQMSIFLVKNFNIP